MKYSILLQGANPKLSSLLNTSERAFAALGYAPIIQAKDIYI